MSKLEIKTETVTQQVHKFGIWFELDEIKEITESLYKTNKEGKLASDMNRLHKDANDQLLAIERNTTNLVSDQEIVESNQGACKGPNCD